MFAEFFCVHVFSNFALTRRFLADAIRTFKMERTELEVMNSTANFLIGNHDFHASLVQNRVGYKYHEM